MSRYLTSIDITETDIKIHEELDSEKEMVMEGRLALRTFGTLAAAHLRERSTPEEDPPRELLVWLALQATGIHQRVQTDLQPIYMDMLLRKKSPGSPEKVPKLKDLENMGREPWANPDSRRHTSTTDAATIQPGKSG